MKLRPDEVESRAVPEGMPEDLDFELVQLGSSNSVHDRTQFESKFDFDFTLYQHGQTSNAYEVDMYLFAPQSLGINQETYSTDSFYADLTHLLRIRTPELRRGPPSKGGVPASPFEVPPLSSVDDYFASHLDTARRQSLQQLVVHDVKMFGCLIYSELKKLQVDMVRVIKRARQTRRDDLIGRFHPRLMLRVEGIHREVRHYRERYLWRLREPLLVDAHVKRALYLVDEYLSYRLEAALVNMHRLFEPYREQVEDLLHQIEALLTGELAYRSEHVPGAGGDLEGRTERRYYRLGLLKKYVSEVLFLQTRRVKRDLLYRNVNAAVGAALAASFAAITNLPAVTMWGGGQTDLGVRMLVIICLGVTAYVFKDRIKELSREYFNAKLKSRMPDYDVDMLYTHFDQAGRLTETHLGNIQEYTRYLTKANLPPDVSYLRGLGHHEQVEPERLESVVHYHKKVNFVLKEELREHFGHAQARRLHDVLRLDVSRFLAKLDDPEKSLSYFDPDSGIVTVEAPRVYHVNLLFRYGVTHRHNGKPQERRVDYERIRMIINKKGIVRLETVVPRGQLGYEQDLTVSESPRARARRLQRLSLTPVRRS